MNHLIFILAILCCLPKLLFAQNEEINQLDAKGNTKLIAAVMQQDLFAFNSLIAAGADVNIKSKFRNYTALHYAAACRIYSQEGNFTGGPHEVSIPRGITMVKALLKAGADVNAVSDGGETALFLAAGSTRPEITELIQILLDANADVNVIDKGTGQNPLMAAVFAGQEKNARLLLDKGSNVSLLDNNKHGVLFSCLKNEFSFDFIKALHQKGADLKIKTKDGETALFFATIYGRGKPDIVSYLIDNGVDVNAQDENGFTAFSNNLSGPEANLPIIDIFMKAKVDLNLRTNTKKNMLHLLVVSGITDTLTLCNLIKRFIAAGADVNAVDVDGYTPLMSFIVNNNLVPVIQILIDAGTNLNISDNKRNQTALDLTIKEPPFSAITTSPTVVMTVLQKADSVYNAGSVLFWACETGETEILRLLIKKRVNLNYTDPNNYSDFSTALIYAANAGKTEAVKLLIQNKVNVNAWGKTHHVTPLMFAAANGHVEVVKALLAAKANVNLTNKNGNTAASYAILNGQEETAKLLITASKTNPALLGQLLLEATNENKPNLVKLLIDYKANVNIKSKKDAVTPLMIAEGRGFTEIVKLLIAAKADVNYNAPPQKKIAKKPTN